MWKKTITRCVRQPCCCRSVPCPMRWQNIAVHKLVWATAAMRTVFALSRTRASVERLSPQFRCQRTLVSDGEIPALSAMYFCIRPAGARGRNLRCPICGPFFELAQRRTLICACSSHHRMRDEWETLAAAGLWGTWETWKRQLVVLNEQAAVNAGRTAVRYGFQRLR